MKEASHPVLQVWSMADYLLNSEYAYKILGSKDESTWRAELSLFWQKFRHASCLEIVPLSLACCFSFRVCDVFAAKVDPLHAVYQDHAGELEFSIPCILHGDEGVGHRRKPVLLLQWGPLLRVGLGASNRLFLITACPHKYYSKYNKGTAAGNPVIEKILTSCGRSITGAYYQGIEVGKQRFFLVFLGLCGDYPFHTKAFSSLRSFQTRSICPHCHASSTRADLAFEDMSRDAAWRNTIFQTVPWARNTRLPLATVPGGNHPSFMKFDVMHTLPHGCGRNFCSSIIAMLAGPLDLFCPLPGPEKRKERCLDAAFEFFDAWLHTVKKTARDLKEFTPENLHWIANRDYPDCNCKAADCNLLVGWLIALLGTMPWKFGEPLRLALDGLEGLDEFLRVCYTGDRLFLDPPRQKLARDSIRKFLRSYSALAVYWNRRGWCLFGFTPKLHYACHWEHDLTEALESQKRWAMNPQCFSTPMMEDFVGLNARISRSVHAGAVPINTLMKYLVEMKRLWT